MEFMTGMPLATKVDPPTHLKLHLVSFTNKAWKLDFAHACAGESAAGASHAVRGYGKPAFCICVASLVPKLLRGTWKRAYCVSVWKFTKCVKGYY